MVVRMAWLGSVGAIGSLVSQNTAEGSQMQEVILIINIYRSMRLPA